MPIADLHHPWLDAHAPGHVRGPSYARLVSEVPNRRLRVGALTSSSLKNDLLHGQLASPQSLSQRTATLVGVAPAHVRRPHALALEPRGVFPGLSELGK